MSINPGALRHRITLQSRSETRDSAGGVVITWSDVATVWAAIEPLQSREIFAALAKQVQSTHRITVRYSSLFADGKVVGRMRAVYGTRLFNITGSNNEMERNRVVYLDAVEGLTEGE